MVRIVSVALVISLFVSLAARLPQGEAVCCGRVIGDVNCDFLVDSRDARDILKYHAGLLEQLDCFGNSNVDGYGEVTSIDAILVLKFDAGLIDHLPPIKTFAGTIVLYRGVEANCLALDTGSRVYGLWDPSDTSEGDRVRVVGFLDDEISNFCGVYPIIYNSSIEVLS